MIRKRSHLSILTLILTFTMVAIQDTEQQAAAASTDDWESMTKEEQIRFAAAKFDEGKSNYIKMDFPNAADCLALSLEIK